MPPLPKSKVREGSDSILLLFEFSLHKILNRDNSHHSAGFVQEGQVTNILQQHFRHAIGDGFAGRRRDQVGTLRADFFDRSVFGCFSEQCDFADVVALADDPGDFPIATDGHQASDVVSRKFLYRVINRKVFVDGVVDSRVATLIPSVGGSESFLHRLDAAELEVLAPRRLRGDWTGNSGRYGWLFG